MSDKDRLKVMFQRLTCPRFPPVLDAERKIAPDPADLPGAYMAALILDHGDG